MTRSASKMPQKIVENDQNWVWPGLAEHFSDSRYSYELVGTRTSFNGFNKAKLSFPSINYFVGPL